MTTRSRITASEDNHFSMSSIAALCGAGIWKKTQTDVYSEMSEQNVLFMLMIYIASGCMKNHDLITYNAVK